MSGIQLFTGRMFDPLWPTPESFTALDLAHGLSLQNRFGGHSLVPYTVAQHCVIMSIWFRKRDKLLEAKYALLHEGEEGLGMCDMPTPIKYLDVMTPYRTLGKTVQIAVFRKFGLLNPQPAEVKVLDDAMKVAEAKILCRHLPEWAEGVDTRSIKIKPYPNPTDSKKHFINEFNKLFPDFPIDK